MTVALYCVHGKDWDVQEDMQGWDVDDDRHEKASRVPADQLTLPV